MPLQLKVSAKRRSKTWLYVFLGLIAFAGFAQNQKIDLGALSVEGELITPGDLTIDSDKEESSMLLYRRTHYKDRLNMNLQNIF